MKFLFSFVFLYCALFSFSQKKMETESFNYEGHIHSLIYNESYAWLITYDANEYSNAKYIKTIYVLNFDLEKQSLLSKSKIDVTAFTEKGENLSRIALIGDEVYGLFGRKTGNLFEFYLRSIDFKNEIISSEKSISVAKTDQFPYKYSSQLKLTESSNNKLFGFYSNYKDQEIINHQVVIYNSETKEWVKKNFKTNSTAHPRVFVVSNEGSFLVSSSQNPQNQYNSSTMFAYCFDDEIEIKEFRYEKIKTAVVNAEASENNTFLIKIVTNGFNNIISEYWRHITPKNFGDRKLFRNEKVNIEGYKMVSHNNKSKVMIRANYPIFYPCEDGSYFMMEKVPKKEMKFYYHEKDEGKKTSAKLYKVSEGGEIIWQKDDAFYGDILDAYVKENSLFVLFTQHNSKAKTYTDVIKLNSINSLGEVSRVFTFNYTKEYGSYTYSYAKIKSTNKFVYLNNLGGSTSLGVLEY